MEDIHEVAEILEEEIGCDTVLKIGRILILYKESAKKEIVSCHQMLKPSKNSC